ncbi:MAG: hypothetical protein JXB26_14410 [Candidatus Aminicenantes bacterium]|nr:hypothetical protein [Candidatus Aminicenantes bacterium]
MKDKGTTKRNVIMGQYFFLFLCFLFLAGCDGGPFSPNFPSDVELTYLLCDTIDVLWMQPFGNVDHGGGNAFFHDGIDMGTVNGGRFFSCAEGEIDDVEINTGKGLPGTNYRIMIKVAKNIILDYHFEIGGSVSEAERENNIFVSKGDWVQAGQHIANLIVLSGAAHVHWGIYDSDTAGICPLDYFTATLAQEFEALYDSGIEKRPASRPDLCE